MQHRDLTEFSTPSKAVGYFLLARLTAKGRANAALRSKQAVRQCAMSAKWQTCSANTPHKKVRPRSDAATDGDRLGRVIRDGGSDQTRAEPSRALLRARDSGTYPQAVEHGVQHRALRKACGRPRSPSAPPPCRRVASRCGWFRASASRRETIRRALPARRRRLSRRGRCPCRARPRR